MAIPVPPLRPKSNAARNVLIGFLCLLGFGFLMMAAGLVFAIGFLWIGGMVAILYGVYGAVISGIVVAVLRNRPR